jgi:uncharacterized protein YbjT (DUF2867 family)
MIVESVINYTFLRPAYFITTLHPDIVQRKVFLPAGKDKFTLIDVRDIGSVASKIISKIGSHVNSAYDLICSEKLSFQEMEEKLSDGLSTKISFESPNLLNFFLKKRK